MLVACHFRGLNSVLLGNRSVSFLANAVRSRNELYDKLYKYDMPVGIIVTKTVELRMQPVV